jgi:hypothetical protein
MSRHEAVYMSFSCETTVMVLNIVDTHTALKSLISYILNIFV